MAKKLGEVIREMRKHAKISQSTLCREAGLSPTILSRLEAGERSGMQFDNLCRIARALDVTLDEIAIEAGLLPPRLRPRGKPTSRLQYNEDVRQVQGLLERASGKLEDLKNGPDAKRQRGKTP
jgi:transcriptional regulator with XRE-family HTH domain